MQAEAKLSKSIVKALQSHGAFATKISPGPYQTTGLPDVVGCYKGYFFGLETKMPGKEGNLSLRQSQVLKKIKHAHGFTAVVTSVDEALEVLERIKDRVSNKRR